MDLTVELIYARLKENIQRVLDSSYNLRGRSMKGIRELKIQWTFQDVACFASFPFLFVKKLICIILWWLINLVLCWRFGVIITCITFNTSLLLLQFLCFRNVFFFFFLRKGVHTFRKTFSHTKNKMLKSYLWCPKKL
jgi:hypothetical protein